MKLPLLNIGQEEEEKEEEEEEKNIAFPFFQCKAHMCTKEKWPWQLMNLKGQDYSKKNY